ncbi:N amino acid transport system protein [Vanrija pseudolonga]|uniref:N amino acid transport system protein n=1 Tax=Vanrija pseudolonga TaxID=143232 RepID=A0AAF1BKS6_9TREE|nr:N amino acid transport system protein [Vanrija pseudolonga]
MSYDPEKALDDHNGHINHQAGKNGDYAVEIAPAGNERLVQDAVFGDMSDGGPNYRAVGPVGSFVLMTKANVGLGVLSIPFTFMLVGMAPGIILLFVLACIVVYCACIIGDFKMNHPEVYAIADAGYIVGGVIGREYFGLAFVLFMIFVAASAMLGTSTALNAVSVHGEPLRNYCTAMWVAIAAVIGLLMASIRTLGKIAWLGWVGLISIIAAIMILTIAVGVQDRPYDAMKEYPTGPWPKDLRITYKAPFADAMSALNNILFAFAATPTYFGIISEMRDPRLFKRSMIASMTFVFILYAVLGAVVYYFCGQFVSSPALGSAGPLLKKVSYGIAIPALLVTLCIYSHLAAKYFFVRILSGSVHLSKPSAVHWGTWLACVFGSIGIAYIIASAIPIFSNLISLVGALIGPSVCIIPYTIMWYHDNWKLVAPSERTGRARLMLAFNVLLAVIGVFLTVAGTYGAIKTIIDDKTRGKPWSCADNSHSVPVKSS